MFFGDDVAAVARTRRFGRRGRFGLLATGAVAACLLSSCESASLKDALTPPPPVSSAAKTDNTPAGADTPVASTSPLPGVDDAGKSQPESAGKTAVSSRRTHSRRHRKTAARQPSSPSPPVAQAGTATRNAPFVDQGAAATGTYPKFVPPKAATSQMSDAEKKKFEETMAARIKANKQSSETPAEAAEREKLLKALAAKHAEDTMKAIDKP